MLVLGRKRHEATLILCPCGRHCEVSIADIRDARKVRLGFAAEREITIVRPEILERLVLSPEMIQALLLGRPVVLFGKTWTPAAIYPVPRIARLTDAAGSTRLVQWQNAIDVATV